MLAIDPAERAGGDDVLRVLGGDGDAEPMIDEAFLGRDAELAALDAALDAGGPVVVAVRGESGVGKTTLLGRGLARAAGEGAVVLAGRCCERESVPYKAIDGVIEALARWLAGQPEEEVRALAPPRAQLLARVFPALAALAPGTSSGPSRIEPADERRQLFEAVRALLGRIARRHRLVVSIDDLQWADADSLAMLTALLQPPGAPPLVLVIAERGDERAGFVPPCPLRQVEVGPLAPADAAALAATLLPAGSPATAAAVAAEAGGHPLFVMELARAREAPRGGRGHAARRRAGAPGRRARRGRSRGRRGGRCRGRAGRAGGGRRGGGRGRSGRSPRCWCACATITWCAPTVSGQGDRVDAYHSRVRAAVLQQLDARRARGLHARLAAALRAAARGRPGALVRALAGGRRSARGRGATRSRRPIGGGGAGVRSRGAAVSRGARARGPDGGPALRGKLGGALVNAGRGAEAARVFQEAAAGADVSGLKIRILAHGKFCKTLRHFHCC